MSLIGLGVALSLVFGFLLLALIAELLYLLWWKKRRTHTLTTELEIEIGTEQVNEAVKKGFFYGVMCWKKTPSSTNKNQEEENKKNGGDDGLQDLELGNIDKDLLLKKGFGGGEEEEEEGVEAELMRLHNLAGPPRFLFTIKEETKEDLESEDKKRSRTRSLSDLMDNINLDSNYKNQGFNNPLFESSSDFNNRVGSSPPPKFKFLRDAEEKLYKRLMEEAKRKAEKKNLRGVVVTELTEVKDREQMEIQGHVPQYPSSSSQVLPLASSPTATTLKPIQKPSSMVH